jgi:ATP-binding cassette subfamily C protein CydC
MTDPLVRLLRVFRPDVPRIALAVALHFAATAAAVGLLATAAWLIATAALMPSIAALSLAVVGVRLFGVSRGVLRYLERLLSHDVTLRLLGRLRGWVYQRLDRWSPGWLSDRQSGDLLGCIIADVDSMDMVYVRLLGPLAGIVLMVLLVFVLLVAHDGRIAIGAAGGLAVTAAAASWSAWRSGRSASRDCVQLRADLESLVIDGVQGLPDLTAFGQTGRHASAIERTGRQLAAAQVRAARAAAAGGAIAGLGADLTGLIVLALGASAVLAGSLNGVHLAVVVLLAVAAFEAVGPLPGAWPALASARAAAERLMEVADGSGRSAPSDARPMPERSDVDVRHLTFSYPGSSRPALEDVSFRLEPGRLLAIVGPSGSGKSTVAALLARFWEPPGDTMWLGGVDVTDLDPDEARSRVALAPQRVHLFTGTIESNLRVARPDATYGEMNDALRRAGLSPFVRSLPEGLRTPVGEQGLALSGGERRKLAVARALLKEAPILVLDEPTAHLDPASAALLLATTQAEAARRAVLLITHRVHGLQIADEILVVRDGRIVERGCWRDLSAGQGWFARMLRPQTREARLRPAADEVAELALHRWTD